MTRQYKFNYLIYAAVTVTLLSSFIYSEQIIKTPAETVNYVKYTLHRDIAAFLSRLESLSDHLVVRTAGRTLPSQDLEAQDLWQCIITEEGIETPEQLNRAKPTFYLVAAKHGNEQSAKEAALRFIRDLCTGELQPLLKQVNFIILPAANPYGNHFDQRRNNQDLDLNRDQVKLESPESETINRIFREWMPEVTMDVHEKGDDYYRVSIGCVSNVNIHSSLQNFSRDVLLKEAAAALAKEKITFFEYLVTQAMGIDSSAGVSYGQDELAGRERMRRYSTTDLNDGRNSPGIYETLSFIQEGASRHDLATLEERTNWQYHGIRFLAESTARHGDEINKLVRERRAELLKKANAYSEDDLVHLRMKYARDPNQPTLTIKQFERTRTQVRGFLKADKKAGDPITFADLELNPAPSGYKIIKELVENWFPLVEPVISVPRPLGYIIPADRGLIIDTLLKHGLKLEILTADSALEVEAYQITDILPAKYDYLPPMKIEVEKKALQVAVNKGDIYISCAQAGANLIPCLLEPQSQYGFIRYWNFQLVPEKGDIFPIYRIVKIEPAALVPYRDWH